MNNRIQVHGLEYLSPVQGAAAAAALAAKEAELDD